MSQDTQRGFTFIEILIVVGLASIVALFGIAMSYSSIGRSSVLQERDLFVSLLLTGARAEALANVSEVPHGVHIDNTLHQYVLFEGSTFSSGSASNRVTPYTNASISINNTGGNDIVFAQLSGDVSKGAGTITLSDSNTTQEITINNVGQINW